MTTRKMPAQKPGRSKQDYATPADFIAAVKKRFGIKAFAYDLAADHENTKAEHFFHAEEDSLKQDWTKLEGDLWLNPPFRKIDPWAAKCAATLMQWLVEPDHARAFRRIFFLVPLGTTDWFVDHVYGKAREFRLHGRLSFDGKDPYPKDVALYVYGEPPGAEVWRWKKEPAPAPAVEKPKRGRRRKKADVEIPPRDALEQWAKKKSTVAEMTTPAAPAHGIPEAWQQPERLDKLQAQLAEHHVKVTMVDLCSWTVEQRQAARAWMLIGKIDERPAFFPSACAACDRGEAYVKGEEFKHTGMGPRCRQLPALELKTPPPVSALDAMRAKAKVGVFPPDAITRVYGTKADGTKFDSGPIIPTTEKTIVSVAQSNGNGDVVTCSGCGGPVQPRSSSRVGDRLFCSAACALKAQSDDRVMQKIAADIKTSAESRTLPLLNDPTPPIASSLAPEERFKF